MKREFLDTKGPGEEKDYKTILATGGWWFGDKIT